MPVADTTTQAPFFVRVDDHLNPLVTGMLMDPVDQHLKTFVHAQRIRIAARAPTIGRFPSAGLPQFIVVGLAQRSADADGLERPDDPAKLSASTLSLLIVPGLVVFTVAMKVGVMPSTTIGTKAIDQECVPLKLKLRPSVPSSNPSADHNHVFGWVSAAGIKVGFQHEIILAGFELTGHEQSSLSGTLRTAPIYRI